MGIQDRDYYREGPSFLDRVGQQGATVWLVAITVGVFVGQLLTAGVTVASTISGALKLDTIPTEYSLFSGPFAFYGALEYNQIVGGEWWRLLTPLFLHGSLWHLFGNMLVLYFTGSRLEERYGSREFVLLYFASGLVSSAIYLLAQGVGIADKATAIGASGAIFGVLVVYAFNYPRQQVLLFFVIPMPVWLLAVLWVGYDAVSAAGEMRGRNARDGVGTGYFAHLGGAFFGLLYYQMELKLSAVFTRRPKARVRPKLRVVSSPVEEPEPEPVGAPVQAPARPAEAADEQLEAKLDAVLEKVSKYGQESLTPEEREILFRASELYKKRRK